jgi:hypothetical protein
MGKALSIELELDSHVTTLSYEDNSKINNRLNGKIIRIDNDWGVIRSQKDNTLSIWGLIDSSGKKLVEFEILPFYSN